MVRTRSSIFASAALAFAALAFAQNPDPAGAVSLNRELCQILLALDAPQAIDRTIKLLSAAPTQEEQLN